MDKLEVLRLAAVRLDEARDAMWLAEQTLSAARKQTERARAEYAQALADVSECADAPG